MPTLAIQTPLGCRSAEKEADAVNGLLRSISGMSWISTDKGQPARVDGLLYQHSTNPPILKAVCEVKCREMTLKKLTGDYQFLWLITAQKISDGGMLAKSLCVPFVGILHLIPDKLILLQRLINPDGSYATNITFEQTLTQETINGGSIVRLNAFVDMSNAKQYKL